VVVGLQHAPHAHAVETARVEAARVEAARVEAPRAPVPRRPRPRRPRAGGQHTPRAHAGQGGLALARQCLRQGPQRERCQVVGVGHADGGWKA
jgi:hypothetical protein